MGEERFEEMTKKLARPLSRRQAVKAFVATAAVGAFGMAGPSTAVAGRCRKNGHKCRQDYECCSFYCDPATALCQCPPGSNVCPATGHCVFCGTGATFNPDTCQCECPSGTTQCGNGCCDDATQVCCTSSYGYQHCNPIAYGC